ncbi:hypothetical protein HDE78_002162 [Rhodanobacter sp. K2T2]|uniref:hypothetical protein n=1 Tax=Rhodanobacter sp. K2T2 TaxID=2723085 RepID=UPI0015CED36A|nr:hypothetical protein [Rhodanobacter sp. K2T2]NYE29204.1 hypothetical protein [Rhodanobacter sp. K2T2]
MPDTVLNFFDEPLIQAFDRLADIQPLTPQQVALILQCSVRWLEEQRAGKKPPPWFPLGKRMVRYAAGPLRNYIRGLITAPNLSTSEHTQAKLDAKVGLDEPMLRGGRKKAKQASFTGFLSVGLMHDEWPFALVGEHRRPIDFLSSLEIEFDVEPECRWLTLKTYLTELKRSAVDETLASEAMAERAGLDKSIPEASRGVKPRGL